MIYGHAGKLCSMHHNYIDMQGKCNKIRIPKQVKNYQLYHTYDFQHARYTTYLCRHATQFCRHATYLTCNLFMLRFDTFMLAYNFFMLTLISCIDNINVLHVDI